MRYRVRKRELALICESIYGLYEAGFSFLTIFELLEEIKLNKEYKVSLKLIKYHISQGSSLKDGFEKFEEIYPAFFIAMIDIGEKTGKLGYVLKGLAMYYKKISDINKALLNALTYPAILTLSSIFMMGFLILNVVPSFADIYIAMNKEIPPGCNSIVRLAAFMKGNITFIILTTLCWGVLIPYFVYKLYFNSISIKIINKLSIIRELREYIAIVLLSIIIRSGISLSTGLYLCSSIKTYYGVNSMFARINEKVTLGKSLSESMMSTGMFSKYSLVNIKLGEESGTLDNRLLIVETELYTRIINNLNKVLQVIGPGLIVIIGGTIVTFILTFILPLFDAMMKGGIN